MDKEKYFPIAVAMLILIVIVAVPLLLIWSLNTLFPVLNIAYNLTTWAAATLLLAIVKPSIGKK